MEFQRPTSRIALLILLLAVIVLSLVGSLALADRTLAATDRRATALDARELATQAERELLRSSSLAASWRPGPDRDSVPREFEAVWILDRLGRVVWRSRPADAEDTVVLAALARDVRDGAWLSARASGGALLLGAPLNAGGDSAVSVGRISGSRFVETLRQRISAESRFSLVSSGQVIAMYGEGAARRTDYTAGAVIPLAGDTLVVLLTQPRAQRGPRTLLWLLGVVAFAGLLVGLARERNQAVSLAERTAELERLYQEVARSNRMKSEFLANVSHELRTPLNAIVGFVEMLREGVYGELTPRQALPVDRIAASATHLRHMVDRLLDIAKIAAGRIEVQLEPLVMRPFVQNVASEMESLVAESGLALSIAVNPNVPRIRTDQTHLRQILINLIGNAVKYTPSGSIQVRADLVGPGAASPEVGTPGKSPDVQRQWVAVQVADTGVGIQREDLERIFDEFEQVNAGARTDSARRGTGLGLAISRRLAKLLGGDLTVTSEPGHGSTFTLWLPVDLEQKGEGVSPELRDRTSA